VKFKVSYVKSLSKHVLNLPQKPSIFMILPDSRSSVHNRIQPNISDQKNMHPTDYPTYKTQDASGCAYWLGLPWVNPLFYPCKQQTPEGPISEFNVL